MNNYKYQIGSRVRVLPSAKIDVAGLAWPYLEGQIGTIKYVEVTPGRLGEWSVVYTLEFDEVFRGGYDGYGVTKNGQGQQISQQHLEGYEE